MIRLALTHHGDGSLTVKIGRRATRLRTHGEAEAFMAGFKAAHLEIASRIAPILEVKDSHSQRSPAFEHRRWRRHAARRKW